MKEIDGISFSYLMGVGNNPEGAFTYFFASSVLSLLVGLLLLLLLLLLAVLGFSSLHIFRSFLCSSRETRV